MRMRNPMHMCIALAATMPLGARAAELPASLTCKAEIVAHCDSRICDIGAYAVIDIDLRTNKAEYCRGERCDTTGIIVSQQLGDWNKQRYLLFTGNADGTGAIHGIISLTDKTFRADGDAGDMFGTCKQGS